MLLYGFEGSNLQNFKTISPESVCCIRDTAKLGAHCCPSTTWHYLNLSSISGLVFLLSTWNVSAGCKRWKQNMNLTKCRLSYWSDKYKIKIFLFFSSIKELISDWNVCNKNWKTQIAFALFDIFILQGASHHIFVQIIVRKLAMWNCIVLIMINNKKIKSVKMSTESFYFIFIHSRI